VPYTTLGKNLMLDALRGTNPTTPITHVGLLGADAGKSVTGVTSTDIFTSTAHGYAAGDLVVLSALTGGANLVAARPYFVLATNLAANTFRWRSRRAAPSSTSGPTSPPAPSPASSKSPAAPPPTPVSRSRSPPRPARSSTTRRTAPSSTSPPPRTSTTSRSIRRRRPGPLLGISSVTREAFAGQGTYTVTDAKLDLLATA
jgi:hypothetical protein